MGKIIETKVDRFDGGIVNDPRDPRPNVARMVTNFDILTDPKRMLPYRSSETGDIAASTSQKQNFCIANRSGTYKLFSLGVQSGNAKAEVLMKDLTTGGSQDLSDSNWTNSTPANNQSDAGATNFNLFVYYAKTGLIYGARAGTHIWAFDPTSVAAFADSHQALSYTNIAQGLVHSQDDVLYIPYDNKIASNNNGAWTTAAITIPSQYYITSICEYGRFLGIAAAPLNGVEGSRVYLWDRDSSLATVSANIDWGEGSVKVLEEIDGYLVGVSLVGGNSTRFKDRIVFKYYNGNGAEQIAVLNGTSSTQLPIAKQKINNRLYFMMQATFNGAVREGVFSIGRSDGHFAIVHERTPNNDTALSSGILKYFFYCGDYLFQSYVSSGTYALSKTDDQATYTAISIWESKRYNGGDSAFIKKLVRVTLTADALTSGQQLVLKYRKDDETSFTTIFTWTYSSSAGNNGESLNVSHSAINIESTAATLPEFKEIEYRIESTGGAVPTGLSHEFEPTTKRP